MSRPEARIRILSMTAAIASAACGARAIDTSMNVEGGVGGRAGHGGQGGGGTGGTTVVACGAGAATSAFPVTPGPFVGTSPMRRLAHAEYDNTVRDLLGDTSRPASHFPDEPTILGYDNNVAALTVPPVLAESYLTAAEALAARARANLSALLPCDPARAGEETCARSFIATFGARAYRRPLYQEEIELLTTVFEAGRDGGSFAEGVELVIAAMLQTPQFLYRIEESRGAGPMPITGWEAAARLSYLLWGSMPDAQLFAAAETGQLGTPAEMLAQGRRLLAAPQAIAGLARFTNQWIPANRITPTLMKDAQAFPDWRPAHPDLLRAELAAFLDHVTWNDGGRLAMFLAAPYSFWNRELNAYYRGTDPAARASDTLIKVELDPARYPGALTRGGVMALLANPVGTSPSKRGLFVRERLLCGEIPPPPNDVPARVTFQSAPTGAGTTRERLATLISSSPTCEGCHALFDPFGLALENFDATGRFRTQENGRPIDTSGAIVGTGDVDGPFSGHADMIGKLADSQSARDCFAKNVFRYGQGRGETTQDAWTIAAIDQRGRETDYDVKEMLLAMTADPTFLCRADEGGAP